MTNLKMRKVFYAVSRLSIHAFMHIPLSCIKPETVYNSPTSAHPSQLAIYSLSQASNETKVYMRACITHTQDWAASVRNLKVGMRFWGSATT